MIETLAIAYYGLGIVVGAGCLIYTFAQKKKEPKDDSYYFKKLKKLSKESGFGLCYYCTHYTTSYLEIRNLANDRHNEVDCKTGERILKTAEKALVKTCKEFELDKNKF